MITDLREALKSEETKSRFRATEEDFTRERVLTFSRVVMLILRGHKLGMQNALNKVFTELGSVFEVPTASAYCQARQKLKAEIFPHLNEIVNRDFYQLYEEGIVKSWHNHRVLACDGTYLNLPDNQETRSAFSIQTNQYETGACVQALGCVLYDLLNDLSLASALGKRQGEKKLLFSELWQATEEDDILVFDRHYADYTILAKAVKEKRHIVVRLPQRRFSEAIRFWGSGAVEQIVKLKCPLSARKFVKENGLEEEIKVRLIRIELETGEVEVVATTLLDRETYPAFEFKHLYYIGN